LRSWPGNRNEDAPYYPLTSPDKRTWNLRTCLRTRICPPRTRHKRILPHPFAFFANGREATNLNRPPSNSVFRQVLRGFSFSPRPSVPHLGALWAPLSSAERVGKRAGFHRACASPTGSPDYLVSAPIPTLIPASISVFGDVLHLM
jgi:hypothetical protein